MINIFLAVYNGEKYLKEQLESIFSQEYKFDNKELYIRIFAFDDGSGDKSIDILREYKEKSGLGKYAVKDFVILNDEEKTERKMGAFGAFFHMVSYFKNNFKYDKGDYFAFCDQDDVWLNNKIIKSYSEMIKHEKDGNKNEALLVHTDLIVTDENLNTIKKGMKPGKLRRIYNFEDKMLKHLLVENYVTGNTIFFNSILMDNIVVPDNTEFFHDHYFALVCACIGKLIYIDIPLVLYRQHGINLLGARDKGFIKAFFDKEVKKRIKKNYDLMFEQLAYVCSNYDITEKNLKILNVFYSIKDACRFKKIYLIIKGGYFKSDIAHTISMMFKI